jgi:hypothetical protein
MADIFVSHASEDAPLIEILIQLIEGGIGIRSTQIFATSIEEQGIPPGVDFKNHIKEILTGVKVVIAVVTPRYYNSAFCMCELGATWALTKDFIPLLVPPIDYNDLRGTLFGSQSLPINEDKKLDSVQTVLTKLADNPEKVARWNSRKAQFLKQLPSVLSMLPPVNTLSGKEAAKLSAERDEYREEYQKSDVEVAALKKQVAELSTAKDREEVASIKKKYSSDEEVFDALVNGVSSELGPLPGVVSEALYYYFKNEEYAPNHRDWGDAPQDAEDAGLLHSDGGHFWVNESHPKIKRAIAAIEQLRNFLAEPPQGFADDYERTHDDLFELRSRPFWERHGLL